MIKMEHINNVMGWGWTASEKQVIDEHVIYVIRWLQSQIPVGGQRSLKHVEQT